MDFADFFHGLSADKPLAVFIACTAFAALMVGFLFLRSLFRNNVPEELLKKENITDKTEFIEQLIEVSGTAETLLAELRNEIKVKEQLLEAERAAEKSFWLRFKKNTDVLIIGFAFGAALAAGTTWVLLK
jgi:hypothetical protein